MPYPGVPASQTEKMERCVKDVMAQGHDKSSAIAICHTSIVGKGEAALSNRQKVVKEFIDNLLRDVDEMTTSGAIAVAPMGMGNGDSSERTPRDPEKVKHPGDVDGMEPVDSSALGEGWTQFGDRGYSIEASDDWDDCPRCKKPLPMSPVGPGRSGGWKNRKDAEGEIISWKMDHDCGARLVIYND